MRSNGRAGTPIKLLVKHNFQRVKILEENELQDIVEENELFRTMNGDGDAP